MPVHRLESGPNQDDPDVLAAGVKAIEAKGEEVIQVLNFLNYPIGEWVVVTRKVGRPSRVEKRVA